MKKTDIPKNAFFDINKFPAGWGTLLFPISMTKAHNSQSPSNYLKFITDVIVKKVVEPKIGVHFVYTDFLYLNSNEKASILKQKFMNQIINHKNALQKILLKNKSQFQIQGAFRFETWNQLYLSVESFSDYLTRLHTLYEKDILLQKYIREDCRSFGKRLTKNQINFFLEEHLMVYLVAKGKGHLINEYVENRQQWILWCYPGNPPASLVYLLQLNPFNLDNAKNPYQNAQYNLKTEKLINCSNIDLETYSII
jgi:hypothetical protein